MKPALISINFVLLFLTTTFGQGNTFDKTEQLKDYYLNNLDDSSLNYYDVTSFLNKYYSSHEKGKGSGYKQFERWKIRNKHFYDHSGERMIECIKSNKKSNNVQSLDLFHWEDMGLDSIYNQAGLIEDLAYGTNNTLYAVARGGGIWKSFDSGVTWESLHLVNSLNDKRFVLNYSCIDLYTNNIGEDILYAGGQDVPLIKSTDSGNSWKIVYENEGNTIREIRISPLHSNTIVAATTNGILKSTDAGISWTSFADGISLEDVAFKPTDDNYIYATGYHKYIRTVDGGISFEDKSDIFHFTSGRCRIETTAADENVVYILTANGSQFGELLRSDDSGNTFTVQSHSYDNGDNNSNNFFNAYGCWDSGGGIAFHAMDLDVSPSNASEVYIGSNTVARSDDNGQSFRYLGYHHWDVHHISFSPSGDLYNGNDGGLFRIINPNLIGTPCDGDGPLNWEFISDDLQIRLVYNTQKSGENYLVHCQDNNAARYSRNSQGDFHWQALYGPVEGYGIDFDVVSPHILYASSYTGNIAVYHNPPIDPEFFWPNFQFLIPSGESSAFLHPLASDAINTKVVYGGYRELYKWDWSNGNTNVQAQKITDFGSFSRITEITTFSQNNKHAIYILKGGILYKTDDSSASPAIWQQVAFNVKKFTSSPSDRNLLAYISSANEIFLSHNQGQNFDNITANLNGNSFNTIEFSFFKGDNNLLLGELLGNIYYRPTLDLAESWYIVNEYSSAQNTYFPLTNIQSIKAYDNEVVVATYGRGAWRGEIPEINPDCPTDYTFSGNGGLTGYESSTISYETDGIIESKQVILQNANVTYDSRLEINLLHDFEVLSGAQLHAYIDGCNLDPNTYLLLQFNGNTTGQEGESPVSESGLSYQAGIFNQAVSINQGDQLIFSPSENILADQGTLEAWIQPTWNGNDGGDHVILSWGQAGGILMMKDGGNYLKIIVNRYGAHPSGIEKGTGYNTSGWLANQWHHVAFTWSEAEVQLYIDGTLTSQSNTGYTPPPINSPSVHIGSDYGNNEWDGQIDELRISDSVRSATEIHQSYINGL